MTFCLRQHVDCPIKGVAVCFVPYGVKYSRVFTLLLKHSHSHTHAFVKWVVQMNQT